MKKWFVNFLFRLLYKTNSDKFGLPIMIRKSRGTEWYYIDRYRRLYTVKETGDYNGTPLIIVLEEQ